MFAVVVYGIYGRPPNGFGGNGALRVLTLPGEINGVTVLFTSTLPFDLQASGQQQIVLLESERRGEVNRVGVAGSQSKTEVSVVALDQSEYRITRV